MEAILGKLTVSCVDELQPRATRNRNLGRNTDTCGTGSSFRVGDEAGGVRKSSDKSTCRSPEAGQSRSGVGESMVLGRVGDRTVRARHQRTDCSIGPLHTRCVISKKDKPIPNWVA